MNYSSVQHSDETEKPESIIEHAFNDTHVGSLFDVFELVPEIIMMLDSGLRLRYANQAFLNCFTGQEQNEIIDTLPGTAFHCKYCTDHDNACGESEHCRFCNVRNAIYKCIDTGTQVSEECQLQLSSQGRDLHCDFRIVVRKIEVESKEYVLAFLSDISHEKRRKLLERIFFHDILNTISGMNIYIDLLKQITEGPRASKIVNSLESIYDTLIDEIQSQKMIVSAENGSLSTTKNLVNVAEFLDKLISQFVMLELSEGKQIKIVHSDPKLVIAADEAILSRVLINMIKNALEASNENHVVLVSCEGSKKAISFSVHNPVHIPHEVRLQLFKRSFSTKGKNRGLGTYSIKLLTEQYLGGKVGFSSSETEGTEFKITIPKILRQT